MKDKLDQNVVVAIDYDGTVTRRDNFPEPECFEIKKLAKWGIRTFHKLGVVVVLWTCRGKTESVIDHCRKNGIGFDYVNEYPNRGNGKKIAVDMYIDDRNPAGCCWLLAVLKIWWKVKWTRLRTLNR